MQHIENIHSTTYGTFYYYLSLKMLEMLMFCAILFFAKMFSIQQNIMDEGVQTIARGRVKACTALIIL